MALEPLFPSFCVFGGALIDRVGLIETEFQLGQSHPGHWQQTIGGVGSNVARHLSQFGASVKFASVFADDAAAEQVRCSLLEAGLDLIPEVTIPDSTTPTYTVMHTPSGDVIAGLADMALHRHMDEAWADKMALAGADSTHWIADTNIPFAALSRLASLKNDKPLFLIVVSPAKTTGLLQLLPNIDGIICNRQEAEVLAASIFPDARSAAEGLFSAGAPFCIVSDGAKASAHASMGPDGELQMVLRAPVLLEVDSAHSSQERFRMTGAGDMFAATSLFSRCSEKSTTANTILHRSHVAARLAMLEDDTCPPISWRVIVQSVKDAADKES